MSATGGGPAKKIILTPLQERLYTILGRDVGEPLPGVRHNPLTPTITIPLVDASPATTMTNNSFSLLDNYVVPIAMPEIEVNVMPEELVESVPPQEISFDQENLSRPSTSDQPPKRRKRQRSARRYAAEDRDHAALETAQSRLEAIEARNAEATLKQAEAINNLAAAINRQSSTTEKVASLLDRFVTSVSKKKLRRILCSSDSESD